jgi:hypothetical protein
VADCDADVSLSVAAFVSDCADPAAGSPARAHAIVKEGGDAERPGGVLDEEPQSQTQTTPPQQPSATSLWPSGWREWVALLASAALSWGVIAAVLYTYVRFLTIIGDGVVVHIILQPLASKSQARSQRACARARLHAVSTR